MALNTRRVTSLCQQTYGCAMQADCPDKQCPGRLITRNGGETVNTDDPLVSPEDMADFFWLGVGFIVLFVIGVPALIWLMRSWPVLFAASQF